jgi:hypothetical protein
MKVTPRHRCQGNRTVHLFQVILFFFGKPGRPDWLMIYPTTVPSTSIGVASTSLSEETIMPSK